MKRVCTLRKVYRSLSKVLLEKLFLSFLYIVAFYRHSVLIVFEISPAGRFFMLQIYVYFSKLASF